MDGEATIDVIVVHYGDLSTTEKLLQSVSRHETEVRIILVDNGPDFGSWVSSDYEVVTNNRNAGFVRGVNQGLALARAEYVVIQNNDTVLYDDALTRMRELLAADPKLGAVGPVMGKYREGFRSWQSYKNLAESWPGWEGYGSLGEEEAARRLQETRAGQIRRVPGMLAFFCTMFRREALAQTGTLSTEFGLGLGDDDDYCSRLRRQGWELGLAEGVLVGHEHRTGFLRLYSQEAILEQQRQALDVFQRREQERGRGGGPGTWPMS